MDRVIAVVGNRETITLLELAKRKEFLRNKLSTLGETNQISDKDVMMKLILEKMVLVIGKEKNIVLPEDERIVASITDDEIKNSLRKEKRFYHDYLGEIKQQYILSRLITSDEKLKNYLSREPDDSEVNKLIEELYEKNKQNVKSIRVSFLSIVVNLPRDLSLKEEKEIESVFSEISNLVELRKYQQAVSVAERKLGKYLFKDATMFVEKPVSIQSLAKNGFPVELLGGLVNIKVGQTLPYPIKGLKIKGNDYAFALKVISREEGFISKDEFKETLLLDPNFKKQIVARIQDDRIREWIVSTFKEYGFSVTFLDKNYEIKI
ncbi:MAG: hypothetical protein N2712_02815 [Brevinematales bacterium]|nr:hypothetical protein [Brevinematales bacterium]